MGQGDGGVRLPGPRASDRYFVMNRVNQFAAFFFWKFDHYGCGGGREEYKIRRRHQSSAAPLFNDYMPPYKAGLMPAAAAVGTLNC